MTELAVISLDGVLRDAVSDTPIWDGRGLYEALCERYRVALVADSIDHDLWDMWCTRHDLTQHAFIVARRPEDPEDRAIRRVRQIQRLRGQGGSVAMLVDADPGVIAAATHLGVLCMLVVHAAYARPEWRPDYVGPIRPWDALVDEIDRTKILRAEDVRTTKEFEL